MLHKRKFDHITVDVRDRLHWLLQQRVEYKVSLLVYKCLHHAAPSYLADMCIPVSVTDDRCYLRCATHGDLAVPRIRLATYGRRRVPLCLVRCCGTHYHLLTVMYHWHSLSSANDRRLFCFPEPMGHHHSASVAVLAVKFVCANTNLLTYLLTGALCKHCF